MRTNIDKHIAVLDGLEAQMGLERLLLLCILPARTSPFHVGVASFSYKLSYFTDELAISHEYHQEID